MTAQDKPEELPLRNVLQGSVLILISNLIYISNNYAVAWTELKASEIVLVRGTFQVMVFGVILRKNERGKEGSDEGTKITISTLITLLA